MRGTWKPVVHWRKWSPKLAPELRPAFGTTPRPTLSPEVSPEVSPELPPELSPELPPKFSTSRITCDIFCRVVDNFGDIGVTWRLARQLANEFGIAVRLIVDDLASFQKLAPEIDLRLAIQQIGGIHVIAWQETSTLEPAQSVIEAFACELPTAYLSAMVEMPQKPVWLNLEYLSAESWVGEHHLLPSPHPQTGLSKHFFFPGFRANTGGVLRERNLLPERDLFLRGNPDLVAPSAPLKIFLFGYANAASGGLLQAFDAVSSKSKNGVGCTIPAGELAQQAAAAMSYQKKHGAVASADLAQFQLNIVPFAPQPEFDRLLWCHDILFVRGEDSFVRAQWAGKPFIWLIYPQAERTHWVKLNAFLDLYCEGLDEVSAAALRELHRAWNDEDNASIGAAFEAFLAQMPHLAVHAKKWSASLSEMPDLATQLVTFITKTAKIQGFAGHHA